MFAKIRKQKRENSKKQAGVAEIPLETEEREIHGEEYRPEIQKPVYKDDQKRYVTECCQAIREVDNQIAGIRGE